MREKGSLMRFLSLVGHEVRTPLTSAKVYLEMIKSHPRYGRATVSRYVNRAVEKLDLLKDQMEDLWDMSRAGLGKMKYIDEEFDFDNLVDKTIYDFQKTGITHQILRIGGVGKIIKADKKRIAQVIVNLLKNAVKYSPETPIVVVNTWSVGKKHVGLSVQDFGLGIMKEDQKKIFELYHRGKDERKEGIRGLGVGLYICNQIIKRYGGKLWVVSERDEGSIFAFIL